MADLTGKTWMAIGETDDPDAVIQSFEAAAAITKGDPVYLSADDKVSPAAAVQNCIGIAVKTVALGVMCPVLMRGRVKVKAGEAIARGNLVYGADASKRVLLYNGSHTHTENTAAAYTQNATTVAADTYPARKLGLALETTTGADDLLFIFVAKV